MAFPSLTELFGSRAPAPVAAPTQAPAGPGPAANPAQPGKIPASPEPAFQQSENIDPKHQNGTEKPLPIDEFKDLFTLPEIDEKNPKADPDAPLFALDPKKLQELASQQNFTAAQEMAELASKAVSGDAQALMQVINMATQMGFQKAAEFSTTVANRTGKTALEKSHETLSDKIKNYLSDDTLKGLNEAYTHPSLAPMVGAIRQQIMSKYPNATPKQVADLTNRFMSTAAEHLSSNAPADPTQRPKTKDQVNEPKTDWTDFWNLPSN